MKHLLFLLPILVLLSACATTYYHAESRPLYFADGTVHVKVKLDKKETVHEGSEMTALNKTCTSKIFKDRERFVCKRDLASIGKVIGIDPNKTATIEFKPAGPITKDTEFMLLKPEAKE